MLCDVCSTIDFEKLSTTDEIIYHASFADLVDASNSGCELCRKVLENRRASPGTLLHPDGSANKQIQCKSLGPEAYYPQKVNGIAHMSFWQDGDILSDIYLNIFVSPDAAFAKARIISGRPVSPQADFASCFALARKWIVPCRETHGASCPDFGTSTLPSRVLDVGPSQGPQSLHLLSTHDLQGEWVALSHCWGRTRFIMDTRNLVQHEQYIPFWDLPPTFRDAVKLTRALGYRYLWIDSLCILQDSHEDWVRESGYMKNYYKQSVVTIAADVASNGRNGFLDSRRVFIRNQSLVPWFRRRQTQLATRAWTLQEYVLSPRTLHYTSYQLAWECQSRKYVESDENAIEHHDISFCSNLKRHLFTPNIGRTLFPQSASRFDPTYRWYNLLAEFVIRDLTYESDKLPAISGIAKEIQAQNGYTYVAGIWLEDIARGLICATFGAGHAARTYRAPSWSWASLDIRKNSMTIDDPLIKPLRFGERESAPVRGASVLDWKVVLADGDPYGRIQSGWLQVCGSAISVAQLVGICPIYYNAYWREIKSHYFMDSHNDDEKEAAPETPDQILLSFDDFPPMSSEAVAINGVELLQISTWDGSDIWNYEGTEGCPYTIALMIVLAEDGSSYRRVGVAEVPRVSGLAEKGWAIKCFTIM